MSKDWKKESRKRVEEAIARANYKSPEFVGWKNQENTAALERARAVIQERNKEIQPNK